MDNRDVMLRNSVGFVKSENDTQRELFRDILQQSLPAEDESSVVTGAVALANAIDKLKDKKLMSADRSALSSIVRNIFDKV